jgi:hypothetical protein
MSMTVSLPAACSVLVMMKGMCSRHEFKSLLLLVSAASPCAAMAVAAAAAVPAVFRTEHQLLCLQPLQLVLCGTLLCYSLNNHSTTLLHQCCCCC